MKHLYFELNMGAAGDMLMAALLELHPDPDGFLNRLNGAGIPGVEVRRTPAVKCGITGTHVSVTVDGVEELTADVHDHMHAPGHESANEHVHQHGHDHAHSHDNINEQVHHHGHDHAHSHDDKTEHVHHHDHGHTHSYDNINEQVHHHDHDHTHSHDEKTEHVHQHDHGHTHSDGGHHHHSGMADIEHLIADHLQVSQSVKANALAVYRLVAEAESHAHGAPVEQIHFHEVGTMDAVADIVGVCMLMEELAPDAITASPVHVGSGQVRCAHGILPVPAPATAHILRDVPIYGGSVRGELCTPTGAAILKHFATSFGPMPVMRVIGTGYGMGKKDFEAANCVRAFMGETDPTAGEVAELSCNLDDMTPEAIAFASGLLFDAGALDVYTIPIGMKKGRPGTQLTCMCRRDDTDRFVSLLFKHTTTLGLRESVSRRYALERQVKTVETPHGPVRVKTATGYGATKAKPEYDDLAKIAREKGLSLVEVSEQIK